MAQEPTSGQTPPSEELLLMRAEEVARTLGLSRSKMYQMMSGGARPTVRVGRAVRVPKAALRDWVAHHTNEAA
jgi:excisionase family DNA binding protein